MAQISAGSEPCIADFQASRGDTGGLIFAIRWRRRFASQPPANCWFAFGTIVGDLGPPADQFIGIPDDRGRTIPAASGHPGRGGGMAPISNV